MSIISIEEQLTNRIAEILSCDPSAISPEAYFHTLGMDSLGFVEILIFIEKTYNLALIESGLAMEDFQNVRSLARCIKGKIE